MQRSFIDQLGATIHLEKPPERIVSLVPSQTELLHFLGLENEVVGITKFCEHPIEWKTSKAIVGGTKKFDFAAIDELKPELIIGNKEENYEEGILALKNKYPVWLSDIYSFEDALEMIREIGKLTNTSEKANALIEIVNLEFSTCFASQNQTVLYLIWRKPWMAAAKHTFIDATLTKIGFVNVLESKRYPELSNDQLSNLNPSFIFLSSEPYPFKEKHVAELKALLPNAKIVLVNGEFFSWYGSRLRLAPAYFQKLFKQLQGLVSAY